MFVVTGRLRAYVHSEELEDADSFCVVVRTEVGFSAFVDRWHHSLPPSWESEWHDDGFEIWGPAPTPRGPAFTLSKFFTPAACLERFVDLLARTELSGELDHFHEEEWPRTREQPALPGARQDSAILCRIDLKGEGYLSIRGDRDVLPRGNLHDLVAGLPRWALTSSRREEIADFVAAWCSADTAARMYMYAGLISYPVTRDGVAELLHAAVQRPAALTPVEVTADTATHSRWVQFEPDSGVITFAIIGWPLTETLRAHALAELKHVLVASAAWSTYGRIRRTNPSPEAYNDLAYPLRWPDLPANPIPGGLCLRLITERGGIPDAFGVQLLGSALAAACPIDDARWVITRLDTGHVLLEHRNLDAWFTAYDPDPTALAQARTDLAHLIHGPPAEQHEG